MSTSMISKSVSMTEASVMQTMWDAIGSELVLLVCFVLGYCFFNFDQVQKRLRAHSGSALLEKQAAADLASGNYEDCLAKLAKLPMNAAVLALAVQCLVEANRLGEIVAYVEAAVEKCSALRTAEDLKAVLSALSSGSHGTVITAVCDLFVSHGVRLDDSASETLIAVHSAAENWEGVMSVVRAGSMPARAFARVVKDALKRQDIPAAAEIFTAMQVAGLYLPAHLVTSFVQVGLSTVGQEEILSQLAALKITPDCLAALVNAFAMEGNVERVEMLFHFAEQYGVALSGGAYDAAMKAMARQNDRRAFAYLAKLLEAGFLTEATCVQVLVYCAEGHNVPLAEHVLQAARQQGCATLVVYSALIRVYAVARLFHKTCDLYKTLLDEGLEPDTVMYGGLIKAAVECGRLDLSRTLLRKSGTMDIQNYMSLFRACGRERNAKKALDLLTELEQSAVGVDTTAYNCVLDVLIKCNDKRAVADLFTKMKVTGYVDTISYNTLLKGMGAGATGLTDANMVLAEMRGLELQPNQITYNSLINYAISTGDVSSAWGFVSNMEEESVPVDNFTCSIMMKGLRHTSASEDVDRTLNLIQRAGVCPDEVLVNTLLDACIRLRDVKRLTAALSTFRGSGVVPSEHAYGTVIKAYGHARAVDEAWATWKEMLSRKVTPSDATVATMVEACVANGAASDARSVLADMRAAGAKVAAPYLSLLKGFAQRKEMQPAMEVYADMQAAGVEITVQAFNAVIDVCARCGDVERAAEVFREMCLRVTPDLTTYATIIKGYIVQGDLEQAIQLFTLMRKRGVAPDAVLFNAVLDGCARKQMTSLAGHILSDMESSGIAPSNHTLAILVKLYGKSHDIDTAFAYVDALPLKYGFEPNAQVYTALMSACVSTGHMQKAQEVFAKIGSPDAKAFTTLTQGYLKHQDVAGALRVLETALEQRVQVEQELIDNTLFMANRRKVDMSSTPLVAKGASSPRGSPVRAEAETPASRFQQRRKNGQTWRDQSA